MNNNRSMGMSGEVIRAWMAYFDMHNTRSYSPDFAQTVMRNNIVFSLGQGLKEKELNLEELTFTWYPYPNTFGLHFSTRRNSFNKTALKTDKLHRPWVTEEGKEKLYTEHFTIDPPYFGPQSAAMNFIERNLRAKEIRDYDDFFLKFGITDWSIS